MEIQHQSKKGTTQLVSSFSPCPRVVKKLEEESYMVVIGNPIGVVINC